jgi:hypothetical protein
MKPESQIRLTSGFTSTLKLMLWSGLI